MAVEKSSAAVTLRASAALPAAGAFDSSPSTVVVSPATRTVTLWATYTRGAVGGYARVDPQVSPDGSTWYPLALADTSTIGGTAPAGVLGLRQLQYDLPAPASASPVRVALPVSVSGGLYLRVRAAEVGEIGTPGTLVITMSEDA